jgi:very-short-patch-repair endonuclease
VDADGAGNPSPGWERGRGEGARGPREPRRFARRLRHFATAAEDALWQALRARKLAGLKFRRQTPVLGYTVDFLCLERKLVVELDGRQHGWLAEYDARRTVEIERQGFAVLRFANDAVLGDIDAVLSRIAAAASPDSAPVHPHPYPFPIRERGSRA